MDNRYSAVLFAVVLTAAFAVGFFIKPTESRANARTGWQGEYFANQTLQGSPAITVVDDTIEMNWFTDAPYKELPADHFSVRWTSSVDFSAGVYRFRVGADDGVRLFIDDKPILDVFTVGAFRTTTRDVRLPEGTHRLKVDYFEDEGLAGVLVDWAPVENSTEIIDLKTQTTEVVKPVSEGPLAYAASSLLPVYTQPNLTTTRLTQIHLYQHYPIVGVSPDGAWFELELEKGQTGWVQEQYIYHTEQAMPDVEQVVHVSKHSLEGTAAADLKLRSQVGYSSALLIIPQQSSLQVLAHDGSSAWLYISWQQDDGSPVEGWVFAPYVQLSGGNALSLAIR